jgi:hypothetical protein
LKGGGGRRWQWQYAEPAAKEKPPGMFSNFCH